MKRYLPLLFTMVMMLQACGSDDNTEPPAELINFEARADIDEHWSASPNAGVAQQYLYLQPLILDRSIVTAGRDGVISAIDIKTGDELVSVDIDDSISAGVAGNEASWLVATQDGELVAIDAATTAILWKAKMPSEVIVTPVLAGNSVFIRTIDGQLLNIDVSSGETIWNYSQVMPSLTLRGSSQPIVTRDHVFVGLENGHIIALTRDKGELLWDLTLSVASGRSEIQRLVDIDGDVELYGQVLYAVGYQGRLAAIDVTRGQFLWARAFSSETGLSIDDKAVYTTDDRGHIWAIDRFNGATLWKQDQLTARRVTRPVIDGDYLLVGDYAGVLHVLSRADGSFVARDQVGDEDSGMLIPPVSLTEPSGWVIVTLRNGDVLAVSIKQLLAENQASIN